MDKNGILHSDGSLLNHSLTPLEALTVDIRALGDALDAAGVAYVLLRSHKDRPIIAFERSQLEAANAAFLLDPSLEGFLAKGKEGTRSALRPLSDGLVVPAGSGSFTVYRPRTSGSGRLRYGSETGATILVWDSVDNSLIAPHDTALTRTELPRDEADITTVTRYGREWRTFKDMFARLPHEVDFDIDMVFSWVDGSDKAISQSFSSLVKDASVGEGDDSSARIRQIDELRYALRSVHMYAPWVRKIFIATDSTPPAWLAEHPKVQIVRSEEFFADHSHLPTHNSHAVEAQLHRIEGLSEHFLYSNDDMFFGRALTPGTFFSPGGVSLFMQTRTRIGLGGRAEWRSGHENSARHNRELVLAKHGRFLDRHLEHCAAPLRRSIAYRLEQEWPEQYRITASNTFRAADDISVTNSLYHYHALFEGSAVITTKPKVGYFDTTNGRGLSRMEKQLDRRSLDMFCLNDGNLLEVSEDERRRRVQDFLQDYYPIPAPWEKDVVDLG